MLARTRFNVIYLIHVLIIMQIDVVCPLKQAIPSDIFVSIFVPQIKKMYFNEFNEIYIQIDDATYTHAHSIALV